MKTVIILSQWSNPGGKYVDNGSCKKNQLCYNSQVFINKIK